MERREVTAREHAKATGESFERGDPPCPVMSASDSLCVGPSPRRNRFLARAEYTDEKQLASAARGGLVRPLHGDGIRARAPPGVACSVSARALISAGDKRRAASAVRRAEGRLVRLHDVNTVSVTWNGAMTLSVLPAPHGVRGLAAARVTGQPAESRGFLNLALSDRWLITSPGRVSKRRLEESGAPESGRGQLGTAVRARRPRTKKDSSPGFTNALHESALRLGGRGAGGVGCVTGWGSGRSRPLARLVAHPAWPFSVGSVLAPHKGGSYLVDPASSHMLVSKIKPCMSKYKLLIR